MLARILALLALLSACGTEQGAGYKPDSGDSGTTISTSENVGSGTSGSSGTTVTTAASASCREMIGGELNACTDMRPLGTEAVSTICSSLNSADESGAAVPIIYSYATTPCNKSSAIGGCEFQDVGLYSGTKWMYILPDEDSGTAETDLKNYCAQAPGGVLVSP
jgi:hypothetical protein